jgi:hypothetical protein
LAKSFFGATTSSFLATLTYFSITTSGAAVPLVYLLSGTGTTLFSGFSAFLTFSDFYGFSALTFSTFSYLTGTAFSFLTGTTFSGFFYFSYETVEFLFL